MLNVLQLAPIQKKCLSHSHHSCVIINNTKKANIKNLKNLALLN